MALLRHSNRHGNGRCPWCGSRYINTRFITRVRESPVRISAKTIAVAARAHVGVTSCAECRCHTILHGPHTVNLLLDLEAGRYTVRKS